MKMDVLTIVCCTPDKPERRAHMLALCRSEGLEPQFTTDMGLFVHRDDPACAALGGSFPQPPRTGRTISRICARWSTS